MPAESRPGKGTLTDAGLTTRAAGYRQGAFDEDQLAHRLGMGDRQRVGDCATPVVTDQLPSFVPEVVSNQPPDVIRDR